MTPISECIIADSVPVQGTGPRSWSLVSGVEPHVETFHIRTEDVPVLRSKAGGPVSLTFRAGDQEQRFDQLYIVEFPDSADSLFSAVTLADQRYWWPYSHVKRSFNIRRAVGFRRLAAPVGELTEVVEDLWYARYSLANTRSDTPVKWTALDVLGQVIIDATGQLPGGLLTLEPDAASVTLPVEDLVIDDPGNTAIMRALGYMPEAAVTIDPDGKIRVYNRMSGREEPTVLEGPEVANEGHIEVVDKGLVSPREIDVLFTRAVELRIDAVHGTVSFRDHERIARNVLPSPDFTLNVDSDSGGRAGVPAGTYITFTRALIEWPKPDNGGLPGELTKFNDRMIRIGMVPFMGTLSGIAAADKLKGDANWTARVAAVLQHYRQTYQLKKEILDRVSSISARRVAVIDQEQGTQQRSPVFANHCILPSEKYFAPRQGVGRLELQAAINRDSYPESQDLTDPLAKAAPAVMEILDEQQGVFRISFRTDPLNLAAGILPSHVDNIPSGHLLATSLTPSRLTGPFGSVSIGWNLRPSGAEAKIVELTDNHRVATILTVIPAAPNDKRSLHRITVRPSEVQQMLPPAARLGLATARGPRWEARIGPGLEMARVAWSDDRADDIDKLMGFQEGEPNLTGLVINEGGTNRGASLEGIARAVAARIWASMATRMQGVAVTPLREGMRVEGTIDGLDYDIRDSGAGTVRMSLPESIAELPLLSFLDASTRALILKQPIP